MASVWKARNCKNWIAAFVDKEGRRHNRSTKTTDRREAQRMADLWEDLSRKKKTAEHFRRVTEELIKEFYEEESQETITIQKYAEKWLARKEGEIADSTLTFYRHVVGKFLGFLGQRAEKPLETIRDADIISYRNALGVKLQAKTVNHHVKTLRAFFKDAIRDKHVRANPTEHVAAVKAKRGEKMERQPFTLDQVRAVLAVANDEWRSLILFGLYTGQRLGDLASLTWANLDLGEGAIRLTTSKTSLLMRIPICDALMNHIESLPTPDDPRAAIHPSAEEILRRQGKTSGLSNQFGELLVDAGLRPKVRHRKTHGRGRGVGSGKHELSFHSLRHTAVSLLKEAGIPDAVVMELIGHESKAMSAHYTHVGAKAQKEAAAAFPDLNI